MIFSSLLKYLHCFPPFCCIIALTLLEQCQIRKWSWDIVLSLVWKATLLVCHCSSIHLASNGHNELMSYEADTSQLHCAKEAEEPSFTQETNLGGRAVPKASGFSRGPGLFNHRGGAPYTYDVSLFPCGFWRRGGAECD